MDVTPVIVVRISRPQITVADYGSHKLAGIDRDDGLPGTQCSLCPGKSGKFTRSTDFKRHQRLEHAKNRNDLRFRCNLPEFPSCKLAGGTPKNLEVHITSVHLKIKNQRCLEPLCGAIFSDPARLSKHRKSEHGHKLDNKKHNSNTGPTAKSRSASGLRYQPPGLTSTGVPVQVAFGFGSPGITFPPGWSMSNLRPELFSSAARASGPPSASASSSQWSTISGDDDANPIIPRTNQFMPTTSTSTSGSDDPSSGSRSSSYAWSPVLPSPSSRALSPFSSGSDNTSPIIDTQPMPMLIDSADDFGRYSPSSSSYTLSPVPSLLLSRASSTFSYGLSPQGSAFGGEDDLDTIRRARRGVMKPHEMCSPPSPQDCYHGPEYRSSSNYFLENDSSYAPHPFCYDPSRPYHH
ncbi:hypothetical protein BDV98DRAFT_582452 [Pterulicium gracile]|uniref:C2H2-type domain-containing protein n=1 Tax=Pterulicium gracile TaxID=1884261 RepID=A0A5C3QNN7_9AGAR|nr:hypothetical protein BDV98DRAFT_582452 [Pterula gracilis]